MRVLLAGATGVIGRQLTPLLVSAGHEVVALVRPGSPPEAAAALGARAIVADVLDRTQVMRAAATVQPEAVVHMATAIPPAVNPRKLAQQFELTNRLRTDGTRNLMAAATEVGAHRIVTQSLAYAYDPGDGPASEEDPLWVSPPPQFAPVLAALRDLEQQTLAARGVVLRFGHLYGPGSIYAVDGSFTGQVRDGKVPLVGGGAAVFSFTHAHDAATAVRAALETPAPAGTFNIVDDDPAPMSRWLPWFASRLGAKPPKHAPLLLARLAVGGWGVAFMSQLRGADNRRAKEVLDWKPRYASWRDGFEEQFAAAAS